MAIIHKTYIDILMLLYNRGSLTAKRIAEKQGIDRSNVYKYLDNLTEIGWVSKEKGLFIEGAEVCYRLTKEGRVFLRVHPDADDLNV